MAEKPWLKEYGDYVPAEITLTESSLAEFATHHMQKYHPRKAYTCLGKSLTYADVDHLSHQVSAYLTGCLGLAKGDRVAIMLPNLLQYPVVLWGILRSGLTAVNVNPLYTPRELKHQLLDSGAKALFILDSFAHTFEKIASETPVENVVVTRVGDLLGWPQSMLLQLVLKYHKKLIPPYHLANQVSFAHMLKRGKHTKAHPHSVGLEDIAFLQYTGGTTGVSKGAVLTHKNLLSNIEQAYSWMKGELNSGQEKIITALPLYHIFSLTANCMTFMKIGGENILIPNPRDIKGLVKEMSKHPFTGISGVNTLFNALLNEPSFADLDFSHLRLTLGGGMAVQKAVADRWQQVTGNVLTQAYGLTETSPAVSINPPHITEFNGSIGIPLPSTEISIRDSHNQPLPYGAKGEICIKGPQVMRGYWNRDDETRKTICDQGWLHTGDIGIMDESGFVRIVDRLKDMILVSGFNVYPNEVEEVAVNHPGILEACAVGSPDQKSGEVVKLVVVKRDQNLTPDSVLAHCRLHLTGYKVPKIVEFRDELPKTNVGAKCTQREVTFRERVGVPAEVPKNCK